MADERGALFEPSGPPRWRVLALVGLGILAVFVVGAVAGLHLPEPLRPPSREPRQASDRWLFGLTAMEGLHLREYNESGLVWELQAVHGRAQAQRYVYGAVPSEPVLALQSVHANIHAGSTVLEVNARHTYFDPRRNAWAFVDGSLRQGGPWRPFQRVFWFPAQHRLEWPRQDLPPILRFWEPQY